jgi:hypothetical protein
LCEKKKNPPTTTPPTLFYLLQQHFNIDLALREWGRRQIDLINFIIIKK